MKMSHVETTRKLIEGAIMHKTVSKAVGREAIKNLNRQALATLRESERVLFRNLPMRCVCHDKER